MRNKGVQVLDRAIRILEVVAENGTVPLTALSAKAKLPVSTASRIVDSLISNGLLEQDSTTRGYRLGVRLFFLSARADHRRDLLEVARPVLERLAVKSREDVGLSALRGDHAVIIDRVDGPQPLKIIDILGQPVPLYCGAFRKVLLAYQISERIEEYLAKTEFVKFTPLTITSKRALRKELFLIRQRGYAVSFGEHLPDAAGVAAPIFGFRDEIVSAVFVVGPNSRITEETAPQLAELVTEAASEITRLLRGERPVQGNKRLVSTGRRRGY